MRQYKIGLWLVVLFLSAGCLEEDFDARPFFTTESSPVALVGNQIGNYLLQASSDLSATDIAEGCTEIADFGFFFDTDRSRVATGSAPRIPATAPTEAGNFSALTPSLDINRWYYFRPFVTCNERSLNSELVDSLIIDLDIRVISQPIPRKNDTVYYQLQYEGNRLIPAGSELGYFVIGENPQDTIAGPVPLSTTEFAQTDFYFVFPRFNEDYRVVPYLSDGDRFFFGEEQTTALTDGWIRIRNLPRGMQNAQSAVLGGVVYVFGGCDGLCDAPPFMEGLYSLAFADQPIDSLAWNESVFVDVFGGNSFTRRKEGISFVHDEWIWHFLGRTNSNTLEAVVSQLDPQTSTIRFEPELNQRRRGAVAFQQDGRYFFGGGDDNSTMPRNDFYELTILENNMVTTDSVISLPLVSSEGDLIQLGRSDAVAVPAGNKYLVGTGQSNASFHNDFFRFTTPSVGNSGGSWEQIAFLPTRRKNAGSFSISGRAFVGLGEAEQNRYLRDLYEFIDDGAAGSWVQREPFPAEARAGVISFSMNGYGCVCGGISGTNNSSLFEIYRDCWLYEPVAQ